MNRLASLALTLVFMALSGCASGPAYKTVSASFPPIPSGSVRIFFYRTSTMGAAVQPDVKLNGEKVGSAVPGGFFFVDRPPGDYQVSTTTELKKTLTFHADAGQTRYVKLSISMGLMVGHVYPELIEPQQAQTEIEKTKSVAKS
jgi:hypothetical protein